MRSSQPGLSSCPLGVVPIVWNNVDLAGLSEPVEASFVLDEIARLGFAGTQHGIGFPDGTLLIDQLRDRGLRLAEVYAAVTCDADGPSPGAYDEVMTRLELLDRSDGDMLVVALDVSPGRSAFAARSEDPACPDMSDDGWLRLDELLTRVAAAVDATGRRSSFHPHVGTFVENASETERLVEIIRPGTMGLCLDVGHYLLGGGDPVAATLSYSDVINHVHLKDVDPEVQTALRTGDLEGFEGALRERVFTELGSGSLALPDVIRALEEIGYHGWIMIEQDTSWLSPSEASAIALHIARYAVRHMTG